MKGLDSCFHLYVTQIDFNELGYSRTEFMQKLFENEIGTQVHYIPVHSQPFYRDNYGYNKSDFPVANEYYSKALSIPLYPDITEQEQGFIIDNIKRLVMRNV